ncbi:hypothetical protein ACT3TZ_07970 [Brachybacterium sp. AOP25-B2-12]|uniref:hypothetical protein n=1 Tax=Brachybacterium sp. AOP25-B2-12 TaxID=3457710 RepID=UPI0040338B3F
MHLLDLTIATSGDRLLLNSASIRSIAVGPAEPNAYGRSAARTLSVTLVGEESPLVVLPKGADGLDDLTSTDESLLLEAFRAYAAR